MNEITKTEETSFSTIDVNAQRINAKYAAWRRITLEMAINIGGEIHAALEKVPVGQKQGWISKNLAFCYEKARAFVRLYEEYGNQLPPTFERLGWTKMMPLLTISDAEEREAVAIELDAQNMRRDELQKWIQTYRRERDAAMQRADEAEAREEALTKTKAEIEAALRQKTNELIDAKNDGISEGMADARETIEKAEERADRERERADEAMARADTYEAKFNTAQNDVFAEREKARDAIARAERAEQELKARPVVKERVEVAPLDYDIVKKQLAELRAEKNRQSTYEYAQNGADADEAARLAKDGRKIARMTAIVSNVIAKCSEIPDGDEVREVVRCYLLYTPQEMRFNEIELTQNKLQRCIDKLEALKAAFAPPKGRGLEVVK